MSNQPFDPPVFSLCGIVGDVQANLIVRCLTSVLDRPEGPACDEIVIGWNGYRHELFDQALAEVLGIEQASVGVKDYAVDDPESYSVWRHPTGVKFVVHRQSFTGDFSATRQANFEMASGIWRGYIDFDDVLAPLDSEDVAESIRIEEAREPDELIVELKAPKRYPEKLLAMPPYINVIYAPYNYTLSDLGRPLERKRRPRIVKWEWHWKWFYKVHEVLHSVIGREIIGIDPTFLLLHQPVQEKIDRSRRNYTILQRQVEGEQARGDEMSPFVSYGLGSQAMDGGDFKSAVELFKQAAENAGSSEEKAFYLQRAVRAHLNMEQPLEAGQVAAQIVEAMPDRPEGYLSASECAYAANMLDYAIKWYEASLGKELPPNAMMDDRIDRCLRPVYFAAPAYLRNNQPEKALAVTAIALAEATDPVAEAIRDEAQRKIDERASRARLDELIEGLLKAGHKLTAERVLDALDPAYGPEALFLARRKVGQAIADTPDPGVLAPASEIGRWLSGHPQPAKIVSVPIDSVTHPLDELDRLAKSMEPGATLAFAASDTDMRDPDAIAARLDGFSGQSLLGLAERLGTVETLCVVEDEDTRQRHVGVAVKVGDTQLPWVPDVTFWCPVFAECWGPWRLIRHGTGGSEEAVVYLANEFARRGLNVEVWAPLDFGVHRGVHVQEGVRWRPIDSFNAREEVPGITIACRAPYAARLPSFPLDRLYVWHQDAMYGGSSNLWTPEMVRACRHLFVSEWQRIALVTPTGVPDTEDIGLVCGDGIPDSCFVWQDNPPKRDPYKCAYISSPMRGLVELLDAWPTIVDRVPEATLDLYYGWKTTPGTYRGLREHVMGKIAQLRDTVTWKGRVPQIDLEAALPTYGVWTYPCQFPEGFAMAGVRATAAGMIPVYRKVAALEEVQYPSEFAVSSATWDQGGREEFIDATVAALAESANGIDREEISRWARRHTWDLVADRLEEDFQDQGLL